MSPLMTPPGWKPREVFSPSGIALFRKCRREWAYKYLLGLRSDAPQRGTMLGTLIHACLEAYLRGGTVMDFKITPQIRAELNKFTREEQEELIKFAPTRAVAGVHLLPKLSEVTQKHIEKEIKIDTGMFLPGMEPIILTGTPDLSVERAGQWYLFDHKSTKGAAKAYGGPWAYALTPETMRTDVQVVVYSIDLILKYDLPGLWCRWNYFMTHPEKHPTAKAVDAWMPREHAFEQFRKILADCVEMRVLMRGLGAKVLENPKWGAPEVLPPDRESPCFKFAGCPMSVDKGGSCRAPTRNPAALVAASRLSTKKEQTMQQLPAIPGYMWVTDPVTQKLVAVPVTPPPNPMQPPEIATAPAAEPAANIQSLLTDIANAATLPGPSYVETPTAVEVVAPDRSPAATADTIPAQKTRKRRRTKAEMAADMYPQQAPVTIDESDEFDAPASVPRLKGLDSMEDIEDVMTTYNLKSISFHPDGSLASVTR